MINNLITYVIYIALVNLIFITSKINYNKN